MSEKLNRAQRRKLERSAREDQVTALLARLLGNLNDSPELKEGDKVRFNFDEIQRDPQWDKMTQKRKDFIIKHHELGTVFTVVYDERHRNHPVVVCLVEDENDPKFLWYMQELKKVAINDD